MLTNYHMHTTFCDGKNTVSEMTEAAIAKGFSAIGFSGHGYTDFDTRYCMLGVNVPAYIQAVKEAKVTYADRIQIYLGSEEDLSRPVNRKDYDYIISSYHYCYTGGKYYPIDSTFQYFSDCLAAFGGDPMKLAHSYYSTFVAYILKRKPDIIGHFDLLTKFEEKKSSYYMNNEAYKETARGYLREAMRADSIFEVNTGAISRGFRTTPYPSVDLLHTLKKEDGKVILSSDSHAVETIDFHFAESRALLKDVGFEYVYVLYDGEFRKDRL